MFAGNGISFHTTMQWYPMNSQLPCVCIRFGLEWRLLYIPQAFVVVLIDKKCQTKVYRRGIVLCVLMNTFYANQQYGSKCWLCDSIDSVVQENRRIRCHFGLQLLFYSSWQARHSVRDNANAISNKTLSGIRCHYTLLCNPIKWMNLNDPMPLCQE